MIPKEQIQQMPIHEKLLMMEALWDGISSPETQVEMQQWHKDLLDARESRIREGSAQFIDWEQAKRDIKKELE